MPYRRLMLCAGEASGDNLAANLVEQILAHSPSTQCFGMAGAQANASGMEVAIDIEQLPGMGLVELVRHFPTLHRSFTACCHLLRERCPEALIVIDYPGFNLKLAQIAHAMGIPVIYYVSPKLWAWGMQRMRLIQNCISHMAVVFPFELPLYKQAGVAVSDVGHPLCHLLKPGPKPLPGFAQHKTITVMPGSRPHELERMMPVFIAAMTLWHQKHPDAQFLIPCAANLSKNIWQRYQNQAAHLPITWLNGQAHQALASSHLAWITSGTASLEAALIGTPHVVCYQVNDLTAWYFKRKLTVSYISLPNLILNQDWIPELLQHRMHAPNILEHSEALLQPDALNQHQDHVKALWQTLSGNKASLLAIIEQVT